MLSTNQNSWFTPYVCIVKWATIQYKNHVFFYGQIRTRIQIFLEGRNPDPGQFQPDSQPWSTVSICKLDARVPLQSINHQIFIGSHLETLCKKRNEVRSGGTGSFMSEAPLWSCFSLKWSGSFFKTITKVLDGISGITKNIIFSIWRPVRGETLILCVLRMCSKPVKNQFI